MVAFSGSDGDGFLLVLLSLPALRSSRRLFPENDLARELGGALGIAVLGSVLQSNFRGGLDFAGGMHDALLVGAGAVLAAAVAAVVLLRPRP